MITQTESTTTSQFRINPATRPGHVHLTVADLERQIEFYRQVIGLHLNWREGQTAGLGAGGNTASDVLRLTESPDAKRYRGTTGLYHFAILLPNRRELARAIGRLFELRYPNYPTDHIFTKTTYLDDPEGQNIELYTESPEDAAPDNGSFIGRVRRTDGTLSDGREPLDLDALFAHLQPQDRLDEPMPAETRLGHVHLYVANLDDTMRFYHDVVGFDNMGLARGFRMGMVSAGRYHHHIGFNTWVGEGAPPPPADALGLRYFTMVLPNQGELDRVLKRVRGAGIATEETSEGVLVRDPSRNAMVLTV